ncbi:MAG TPA: dockerin type I domain-containing protein [Candidatus Paceibacterota bacterium]|nr:dockerin type I domain-containing protein [Candidatus Paceibacterota bacterium]
MKNLNKNYFLIFTFILIFYCFFITSVFASEIDGTISSNPGYAFGEKLGWINFGCDNCNVHITDTALTGFAWSRQYGWINLSPDGSGVTNNCLGELGGKAWSKTLGWIDFSGTAIDNTGKFTGIAGISGTKTGRINFDCNNCDVSTDWLLCSLRESPAQVVINSITDRTVPSISANITITNEGLIDTEYQYEWCVVSDINNSCGGGDDIFYSSAAKLISAGQDWTVEKTATVPDVGTYYFKLVVYYGVNYSIASQIFNAVSSSGGGMGGGSGNVGNYNYDIADFNRDHSVDSIDFSILLYFFGKNYPFSNKYVDINKDNKVDSIDFSILLYHWGRKTI